MTPQQEQALRNQAKAKGYSKVQEDQFVQFASSQPTFSGSTAAPQSPPQSPAPAPKQNILQKAGTFFKEQFTGVKNDNRGFVGSVVDETVGSKGLLGVAQMPGRVAGQFGLEKDKLATEQTRASLEEQTRQLAIRIRSVTDPEQKRKMQGLIDENRKALGLVTTSAEDLNSRTVTPREAVATTVRAGATVATGSGSATKNLMLKAGSKLPVASGSTITKLATAGRGLVPRAVEQAGINVGFNAAGNIEEGRPLNTGAGEAALSGAALPVIGTAAAKGKQLLSKGSDSYAARIVNSLIKPLSKDFSYGKNPGRGVAAEGITFANIDEGIQKVQERKSKIGQEIHRFIKGTTWRFNDVDQAFAPLASALEKAKKSPRTNSAVIKRIDDIVKDLFNVTEKDGVEAVGRKLDDMTAEELFQLKQDVAELTRFTGQASDDQIVNKALKETYGQLAERLVKAIPELAPANERYADLVSAEIAMRYRDKVEQRLNLVSLGSRITAVGTAVGAVIASGGTAVPALLAGAGVAAIEKALGSARVKTRVAKWLSTSKPAERQALFKKIPALKNAVERVFGYSDSQ